MSNRKFDSYKGFVFVRSNRVRFKIPPRLQIKKRANARIILISKILIVHITNISIPRYIPHDTNAPMPTAPCGGGGGACKARRGGNTSNSTAVYDCGNPVQYVCGRMPAVLFYLLDRHAPLAMTKGSKCSSPHFLCHSRAGGNRVY